MKLNKETLSFSMIVSGIVSIFVGSLLAPPPKKMEDEERVIKSVYDPKEYYASRR